MMPEQLRRGLARRRARPRNLPPRPLIEDLPAFPISLLKPCWPPDWITSRTYQPGFKLTTVRSFRLYRSRIDVTLTSGKTQTVPICWQVQAGALRFRGRYQSPGFTCQCGRRAKKLYLLGGLFSCRRCAWRSGARYASQTADSYSRPYLQRARLISFVKGYPYEGDKLPARPPTWHRKSYSMVVDRYADLSAKIFRGPRRSLITRRRTAKMIKPLSKYDLRVAQD